MSTANLIADAAGSMQDRLARTYGRIAQADQLSTIATTDIGAATVTADPDWNEALTRAMAKSNALVEAHANILHREEEVAQREQQLRQRERALHVERSRLTASMMFAALTLS